MSDIQQIMCDVETEFGMAGLGDGLYADFAKETAERYAEQLRSENAVLRAEVTKWKNESVIDANTVYSLSCQLAQRTGEVRELAGVGDDLILMLSRMAMRLGEVAPDDDLPGQARLYLKRNRLEGGPLRQMAEERLS